MISHDACKIILREELLTHPRMFQGLLDSNPLCWLGAEHLIYEVFEHIRKGVLMEQLDNPPKPGIPSIEQKIEPVIPWRFRGIWRPAGHHHKQGDSERP
mmetsp:Transcript_16857/g.20280  ORF Transcript_16857/g.20280 Transcript_16857/m.20280 type:complete len:99 (-) Transcript_16857:957-1253(-)